MAYPSIGLIPSTSLLPGGAVALNPSLSEAYPYSKLFPSSSLFPGGALIAGPDSFTNEFLESTQFWNDPTGYWAAYNAAISALVDPIFSIVGDLGDPDPVPLAVTTSDISTGINNSVIEVGYLAQDLVTGTEIDVVGPDGRYQTWTVADDANAGSTVIYVALQEVFSLWPYDAPSIIPEGSQVQLSYLPSWSQLLDPSSCPDAFLTFLGQFIGVPVTPQMEPVAARLRIFTDHAHDRGTPYALLQAATRFLGKTQSVDLIERTNANGDLDAYHFIMIVLTSEVLNAAMLKASVDEAKPAGLQWTLVQTDSWTISQMEAFAVSVTALEGDFHTLLGLELKQVGK